ncbi:MAG: VWA domain-containing protein [Planctomycetaceae bacterium]|nr:VWA domain-containing protein [Planctomycetaceae bacterium]
MSFSLLNFWMLLGLAGVALPVLAHLLSKKKYDVLDWGAMQFLELGRNTRRKIRLEQLLLMLLRMGLIALIALAMARPWAQGGWLANLVSTQSRDVVIVVDGSYSMGWEGKAETPHAAARQWVHEFLEDLRPGDTVALLDARDRVRAVIENPTRDLRLVRDELGKLPEPSGTCDLADATARAVQILARTSNLARDVVVLTDGQSKGWKADDANLWTRFDDLRQQPSVPPRVWVVNVTEGAAQDRTNFSVDRLELSRELTVPDFPVRITTRIRSSGSPAPTTRRVYFEVDGQRIAERTMQVQLPPTGEATVDFEHRFANVGSHVVSVVLDADNLPGDNRSDAAINISQALPVLLVDGAPNADPVLSETFFAKAALSSAANRTPWVQASVVTLDRWTPESLNGVEVVVLANVKRVADSMVEPLKDFVARGGGLLVAAGDQTDAAAWNKSFLDDGKGLLPATLESIEKDKAPELQGIHVVDGSLELPWMERFQAKHEGGFTESRFAQWWKMKPVVVPKDGAKKGPAPDAGAAVPPPANDVPKPPAAAPASAPKGKKKSKSQPAAPPPVATPPLTAARLETSDPLLVLRRYGRGGVALLAAPLDADWSTLPAKSDFVPFLHEVIFVLAAGRTPRNVDPGTPLVLPIAEELNLKDYRFYGPSETDFKPELTGDTLHPAARLDDTTLPGVYTFRAKDKNAPAGAGGPEMFVVRSDRSESDLTPLDDTQRALLTKDGRMSFITTLAELQSNLLTDVSRAEFWPLLMFVFLALLVGEVVMTRRLVQGGHAQIDDEIIDAEAG